MSFADVVGLRPEHLARREVDEPLERLTRRQRRLEDVVRADQVHAHRPHRALEDGVDARDRGCVDDVRRAAGEVADDRGVEHVALDEGQVRVLGELGAGERVAVEVVEGDDLVVVDEPPRERRRDESGSARDEDPLPFERHAASLQTVLAGALHSPATVGTCEHSSSSAPCWPSRARPGAASPSRRRPATRCRPGRPTEA